MALNKIATTILSLVIAGAASLPAIAQEKTDSLILNVGKSKIIFLINDKEDLKSMQEYDLNEILDHLSLRLTGDSTIIKSNGSTLSDTTVIVNREEQVINEPEEEAKEVEVVYHYDKRRTRTKHSFNFDIGTNNYVTEDGKFPDENNELYTVKPFGSWYVGINSIYKSYIGGPLYLEWGGGVSWYNFKFENTRTRLEDTDNGAVFFEDLDPDLDFDKSKLTVFYGNLYMVPMLQFGKGKKGRSQSWRGLWNDDRGGSFRIGAGGYIGYKLDSYTKFVIDKDDDDKVRNHDNFHLENLRYGARLQMGYRGTDLFLNVDINELFIENKGPKLHAFSFGIIL
ncbi:hypothetical protein E1176_15070 [Fulvivirga sp. RKSG066]|uniref:hypothetical protein n=1 Tax=Fulvivirga aurantia TaxID=2529383 RepID=UPI0012BB7BA2|nr:hypothetical protein [Fulvivirga aurantia]MTI22352.1 hypothetical protein [Fulvivirga aurantia]